jgi:DNA-binding NarL/FixJ family response regulator
LAQHIARLQPDVVLMDIDLGPKEPDGVEWVKRLKPEYRQVEFVMLTNYGLMLPERVFEALQVGATGYLLKNTTPDKIAQAIREVNAGGSPMSPEIARRVAEYFQKVETEKRHPKLEALTASEQEVVHGLKAGLSYQEIADKRFVELSTIQHHVRNIYQKLEVHSRAELMLKY